MSTDKASIQRLLLCWVEPDKEQNKNIDSEQSLAKNYNSSGQLNVLCDRLLAQLRETLPHCQITLLSSLNDFTDHSRIQSISTRGWTFLQTIDWLRQRSFDAALVLTPPNRSPYAIAYLCYLAGVPIRIGQSREFGGSILSTCITPCETNSIFDSYWHLFHSSLSILCGCES
jgi:hypothetical protein